MRITHHRDGTYSLTDLQRADVRQIANGLDLSALSSSVLASGRPATIGQRWTGFDDDSAAFFAANERKLRTIVRSLEDAIRWHDDDGAYLPRGASTDLLIEHDAVTVVRTGARIGVRTDR